MVQVNLTMGFALHYGLFCALLASLIRSSVFTHSLISLLAKRKIAAYCCAKSSSTMPGIFFVHGAFLLALASLAVVAARVEDSSPLPSLLLGKTPG